MLKDTFPYQVRNIPDDEEELNVPDEDVDVIEEGLYALSLPVVTQGFGSHLREKPTSFQILDPTKSPGSGFVTLVPWSA